MRVLALADLHLSFTEEPHYNNLSCAKISKPMDIFGDFWQNHLPKLYENWQDTVRDDDIVLVPGDISWAMTIDEGYHDFQFISKLKGKLIVISGNHDYWWSSISKARKAMPNNVELLQNNAVNLHGVSIVGSRLWNVPGSSDFKGSDEKIYKRELLRLEMSLKDTTSDYIIGMSHFMPVNDKHEENEVIALLKQYPVKKWVYGHLHSLGHKIAINEEKWGIDFKLVSADYLDFMPKILMEM